MPKIDQKIKADENKVLWMQCRAAVDNKIGKFEAAIEDYTKLEEILGEKYAITSSGKGDCYFQKGDYNTALAMYKEANELEETAAANAGIARILLLQNEATEALVYANKAVSLALNTGLSFAPLDPPELPPELLEPLELLELLEPPEPLESLESPSPGSSPADSLSLPSLAPPSSPGSSPPSPSSMNANKA